MLKELARAVLPSSAYEILQSAVDRFTCTPAALSTSRQDEAGLPSRDPGIAAVLPATTAWLCRAQDRSVSHDGGFARVFDLNAGWDESYPETTGYIVPTLIEEAAHTNNADLLERARRALNWLVSIQHGDGGFQGGTVARKPKVTVTFNTGQILLGLAAGAEHFGDPSYFDAMHKAARFLSESRDSDGAWRSHPTPFAEPGDKVYETHVSWGLFEAHRIAPSMGYAAAGLDQVHWALTRQSDNGWFADNDLDDPRVPLTHTIGYALRGVIEAYRLSGDSIFLKSACRTADALLTVTSDNGWIAGRLDRHWRPAARFACLTGTSQIAACWILLGRELARDDYVDAARRANAFVRRTIKLAGDPDHLGGVKGSFPVGGSYQRFQYPNWAAKFTLDAQRMEASLDR